MLGSGRDQHGAHHLLQVAEADRRIAIAPEDHLALLGDLEAAGHRPRRLAPDRATGRPATPADGASAAVEERQLDVVPSSPPGEGLLGVIEGEVGGEEAGVLGSVGVSQHHFQAAAPAIEPGEPGRCLEEAVEHGRRRLQVGPRLEEGNDVQLEGAVGDREPGELVDRQHVGGRAREADHVAPARFRAVDGLQLCHRPQRREDLLTAFGARLREDLAMNVRMLPHLQRRQVEAERLQLPDERLQVPGGDATGVRSEQ